MRDVPDDFKIEHDRLVYEMEPIARRLFEIIKELPSGSTSETIFFNGFTVTIKKEKEMSINEKEEAQTLGLISAAISVLHQVKPGAAIADADLSVVMDKLHMFEGSLRVLAFPKNDEG